MNLPWLTQGCLSQEWSPMFFQSQREHVFYSEVPGRGGWSFVVRHDPRGRLVKYNLEKGNEEGMEEEDDDEYHDQHELDDHVLEEYIELCSKQCP